MNRLSVGLVALAVLTVACGEDEGDDFKLPWEKSEASEKPGVAEGSGTSGLGKDEAESSGESSSTPKSDAEDETVSNPEAPEFTKRESDELRQENWGNGTTKARGYVRRDENDNYVRVGPWKFWYRKGSIKESGSYVGGKKQGRWEEWHSNGQKESERHYKMDREHGSFSLWKKNGQLRETGAHRNGVKHGTWKRWYKSNAQQEYERHYSDGLKTGRWLEWSKKGQKESDIQYSLNLRNGEASTWHANGQRKSQGSYKNDVRHGKWITWYRKGQKKLEAEFAGGEKISGTVREWTSKGKELDPDRVRAYIYGYDGCGWTRKAVANIKETGVNYAYRRTDKSRSNYDRWKKAARKGRCRGVPVVVIDGKTICGYSPKEYESALK